jgi:3-isopropylmalate/(R)-2-methylmalate dehydratase large subunit
MSRLRPQTLAQTLAQKLIAKASGRARVEIGEIITCAVDLAMFHDSSGPRRLKPMLDELDANIWDSSKVVLVIDHYVPEQDDDARRIVQMARDTARSWKLEHVFDSKGICHVVLPESGFIRPGMLCVGGDSHSPTGGAFGCYMFGIGATEMLGVVVSGKIWLQVPETLRMNWNGTLAKGVCAKDMMLSMIGRLGMNGGRYQALEFSGSAVRSLCMQERMTLANMSAELGAQVGLIAADACTIEYLRQAGVPESDLVDAEDWHSDPDAPVQHFDFDASTLAPQVAAPHSPANTRDVTEYSQVDLDVAYIGACTGAKLVDLRAAAEVLRGHKIAGSMSLIVAPASERDQAQAEREGVMGVLRDAGAQVLANTCGACAGYGNTLAAGARVISSTARNFKGRMGPTDTQVYLASPYTVAASAIQGRITDPRAIL